MDNEDKIAKAMEANHPAKGVVVCVNESDRRQFERHEALRNDSGAVALTTPLYWDEKEFTFDAQKHAEMVRFASSVGVMYNFPDVYQSLLSESRKMIDQLIEQQDVDHLFRPRPTEDAIYEITFPDDTVYTSTWSGIGVKPGGFKPGEFIFHSARRTGKSLISERVRETLGIRSEPIQWGLKKATHASYYSDDGISWREQRENHVLHMEPGQLRSSTGSLRFYQSSRPRNWPSF